jgi:hypothetical protein
MVDNNHRVPLVELALLPSTPAKAPAGLRRQDRNTAMDCQDDGAWHALCRLRPLSLACWVAVGHAFSPHPSNHNSHLTVATRSWRVVGRVPEGPGWSHVAVVAHHFSIDVKCAHRLDCPGELRRTVVPVPVHKPVVLPAAQPLMSSAHRFDCPRELRCTAIPVATISWCVVGGVPERPD